MALSQNRWTVHTSSAQMKPLRWITGRVHPDAHAIFDYIGEQFNKRVEPIRKADSWGYAYRAIRGKSSGYSNHASGTAVDFNATTHPLGKRNTFNAKQRAEIRSIIAPFNGAVRWGGDYSGRPDDMHLELNAPPGSALIRNAVAIAARGAAPSTPTEGGFKPVTPTPQPTQPQQEDDVPKVIEKTIDIRHGGSGWQVTDPFHIAKGPIKAMNLHAVVHGPEGARLVTRWVSWVPETKTRKGFWDRRPETVHTSHRAETDHQGFTVDDGVQLCLDVYTTAKPAEAGTTHRVIITGLIWE